MWVNRSSYYQLKQQDKAWKTAKKNTYPFKPLQQYINDKALKNDMVWVYISGDHLGKIEDAPVFYKQINTSIYKRYINGKSSFVKHIPRHCIKVTVDRNWWTAKFGEPV